MSTIGYATLQVFTSIRGVAGDMSKQLSGPMAEAGKKAGNQLGQGAAAGLEQSKAKVERASAAVAKARSAEADAAGKVRVAEAQLQTLRSKGVTDAGRIAAAEERRNAALRNAELKANAAATADRNLARAKDGAANSARGGAQAMQQFGDATDQSNRRMSGAVAAGALAAKGIEALGSAALSSLKFIAEIGTTFTEVRSKIQLSTGAAGGALDQLNQSVKNVAKGSPAAIGTIAERMTVLYQRTGLTGETLETLTKQVNKAGAALGQDLDLKQLTGTMATFGVQGRDISGVLDDIFRVSRNTGMGMNEIISAAKGAAPSLQEFGFSLSDSAALIGSLDKAGVDASGVLATFGRGLVNVAKAGQSPKQAFADVTTQIQDFIKQGNIAGAVNVAGKIFGTRGAVQFVNAVKSGAVSMDQLTNTAAKQGDSILDAEGATVTWTKTWNLFKNNVIIALEPLATRFFNVFIEGMTWLRENGVTIIQTLATIFTPVFDVISPLAERIFPALGTAVVAVGTAMSAVTGFVNDHRTAVTVVATVIGAVLTPYLITLGVQWAAMGAKAVIAGAQNTAAWIALRVEAAKSAVVAVASAWKTVGGWALMGARATAEAAKSSAAWIASGARSAGAWVALRVGAVGSFVATSAASVMHGVRTSAAWVVSAARSAGGWLAMQARAVGAFVATSAAAAVNAGRTALAWVASMGRTAVSVGVATAAFVAQRAVLIAGAVATGVMSAAQWALNAAMSANPIGAVIAIVVALVAAIVLAYKNSETFRNIVQAAWNGIKTAVGAVWNWLSTTVFPFFKAALSAIGTAAMWLWNNAIMPAFNGIKAVIGFVWGGIKFYFDAFMATMRLIGSVVAWLWNNAIVPAFNGIKAAAQFMWTGISVIFGWFKAGVGAVGQIVRGVVDTIIKPAWNGVKTAADFMWGGIKQIFDWIKSGWNLLATGIRTVVDTIIKPAFEGIKTALRAVGDFFGTVVDGIKTAWDKLKGFVATPINFVINTVWNNGLLKAWNTIAGFLPGLKQMSPLSPVAFKEGGSVPMTPGARRGKDSVNSLLMPDEHVWDVQDVAKSGGQGAQYRMRDMISRGQPFTWTPNGLAAPSEGGPLARFAEGGAVEAGQKLAPVAGEGGLQSIAVLMRRLIFKMWPKIKDIGGYRQDAYPEHPSGRALDVMVGSDKKTGDQVNAFAHANNPKFPLTHSIWQQSMWYPPNMRREPMEDRGSPTQNHMDHPHLWWQQQNVDPNVVPEGLVTSGFGGPSAADMMNIIKRKITEILDKALQPIKDGIAAVIGSPPPEWLGIPPKALDITKTKAIETAFDLAGKLGEKLQGAYDAAKKVTSTITNAVTAPGRWVGGLFRDQGGFLPTGKSVVTNETGKPEAVLNWQQLARIKELMANGVSLAQAATEVGVSPDAAQKALDTNTAGGGDALSRKQERERSELDIQRKHKDALDKLRDEYERNKKAPGAKDDYENKKRALERAYEDDRLKRKQDYETREAGLKEQEKQKAGTAGSGDPSGSGEEQKPGRMKSFVELGRDAGGIIAGGIAETLGLPSWLTDPASALQGDDGSNVRVTDSGAAAGNSAITGGGAGGYSDPTYGDGSTVTPGQAPLSKMPDLAGVEGMPNISYSPSGGAEQWRPLAQWAIDYVNQSMKGPAQLQAMVEQIGDESGGNPKAQNNYDINAQNGVPSGGLLQVIEPTFQANRDPKLPNDKFHPGANLVAALRYYVPKYGKDLTARWGKGKGGYKFGGYTGNLGVNQLAGFVHGQEFVTSAGPTRKNIHLLELIQSGADVESALIGGYEQWGSVADRAPRQLATAGSGARTTNITVFGHTAGDIANEIGRKEWRGSGGYGSRER